MKTTKNWSKGFGRNLLLAGMFGKAMVIAVLAFGLVVAGCDDSKNNGNSGGGGGGTTTNFEGTWTKGIYKVIISGMGYTIQVSGSNYQRGIFSYNDTTVSFTGTHDWYSGSWVVAGTYIPSTFGYTVNASTLTLTLISAVNAWDTQFVGNWVKQ